MEDQTIEILVDRAVTQRSSSLHNVSLLFFCFLNLFPVVSVGAICFIISDYIFGSSIRV